MFVEPHGVPHAQLQGVQGGSAAQRQLRRAVSAAEYASAFDTLAGPLE
jgi:hypothetical protein